LTRLPLSRSGRTALEVATRAAEEAGSLLLDQMYRERQLSYKEGRANIVTEADMAAEKEIIGLLQHEYPDHNILSEESPRIANGSQYTWVIDPMDGTNNYAYGIPHFSVALALVGDEEVLLGVTYDPVRKEVFAADRGGVARLNGQPIAVAERTSVEHAFIGCDMGYEPEAGARVLDIVRATWPRMAGLRVMGSAVLGLAYVACGRLDGYIHPSLYPWDLAGGILLVQEAGGVVTGWEGEPVGISSKRVVAGSKAIQPQLLGLVRGEYQPGLESA